MGRAVKQAFDNLSDEERRVVGAPDDYAWDKATVYPARSRPETVQFSLRAEQSLVEGLQAIAAQRDETFSEVVREALYRFVQNGGRPALANVLVSFPPDAGLLLQVEGRRAETSRSRRDASPDEHVPTLSPPALTG
jgi:hypothetical protein